MEECKELKVLEYKGRRKFRLLTRDVCFPVSKYFVYLSGLTMKELLEIARKCMIQDYLDYKKADLVGLINYHCVKKTYESFFIWEYLSYESDITHELLQKSVEKRMFQDSLRAWVGLFVSDESVSEHYAQVILDVLSPMTLFEEERSDTTYVMCNLKDGKRILFREPEKKIVARVPGDYDSDDEDLSDFSDEDW